MSNFNDLNTLIASFSGVKNVISFPVVYLDITQDMNCAILLNQLIFWSDKTKRTDGYFYKTYQDWQEEIHLSKYQVSSAIKKLKRLGFVETKIKKADGAPTVHYKVEMDNVSEAIVKKLNFGKLRNFTNESKETSLSLTDDYTDNYNIDILSGKPDSIPYSEIIGYLNSKTGKKYKVTQKWKDLIKARFNEGQQLDDFKRVIDVKSKQWLNNPEMSKYLRPQTLFGNKFDEYRNESSSSSTIKKDDKTKPFDEINWSEIYG